jgi:tight adherence protein C
MGYAQLVFLLLVFAIVGSLAWLAMMLFAPEALRERLRSFIGKSDPSKLDGGGWAERVAKVAQPLTKLSVPDEGWEKSSLRTRFMNAGWRNPVAPTLYFASKTLLALLIPAIVAVVTAVWPSILPGGKFLFALLFAATLGYYVPNVALARIAERRRRAGFTKEKALRNFALRSGVEDVDTLVAMLIQSERFGTSVGDSLRVYSENLRTKRRMMAEECAAKIGLKLLFPLIFCIFPTLLMVLLGPAMIQISRTLGTVAAGN